MNTETALVPVSAPCFQAPAMSCAVLPPVAPTVSETLLNRWFRYLDVAPKSLATYKTNIRPFVRFLTANNITTPTRETIIQYRDSLKTEGKAASTVAAYLAAVRLLFGWLEQEGVCRNIAARVKAPHQTHAHKRDYVSAEASARILSAIDTSAETGARDYAIIAILAVCGLRAREVANALCADLHTEGGDLILRVLGKGRDDKGDFVRVPPQVQLAISRYLAFRPERKPCDPLFVCASNHGRGARLSAQAVSVVAKSRMAAVGICDAKLTCHSFRHGAATLALLNGCSLEETSKALRHLNLQTTMIYNHSLNQHRNPCAYTVEAAIFGKVAQSPATVAG